MFKKIKKTIMAGNFLNVKDKTNPESIVYTDFVQNRKHLRKFKQ